MDADLILSYLPTAKLAAIHVHHRYSHTDLPDLYSQSFLILCQELPTSLPFGPSAVSARIYFRLVDYVRYWKLRDRHLSDRHLSNQAPLRPLKWRFTPAYAIDHSQTIHTHPCLTTQESAVIRDILQGKSNQQIARALNLHESRVSQVKGKAVGKLRKALNRGKLESE